MRFVSPSWAAIVAGVPTHRIGRDIISAYVVTAARVFAWLIVTAGVFRVAGRSAFALLGLVQSTVGILEYAAIGLSPAIIRLTAEAMRADPAPAATAAGENGVAALAPRHADRLSVNDIFANGFAVAVVTALGGGVCLAIFMSAFKPFMAMFKSSTVDPTNVDSAFQLILMVGIATLLRMMSDAPAAVLQIRGQIFTDNVLLTLHEIIWASGTALGLFALHAPWQQATGIALLTASSTLLILRVIGSHRHGSGVFNHWWRQVRGDAVRKLLLFGGMVVAAQMADYLYSPSNNLLIAKFIDLKAVGDYVPAVTIDGGMLLLVSALASVLLPHTALAHAAGDGEQVRRYYVRGTLATAALLLAAAPAVGIAAPWIFQYWLGSRMPVTCAILHLVLIHTVIGGTGAIARSILLAIGKVGAFTLSVVIAGIGNVIMSYLLVRYTSLGLRGIVLGTIIAVTCRCAFWLPWYTLRALKDAHPQPPTPLLQPPPPALIP